MFWRGFNFDKILRTTGLYSFTLQGILKYMVNERSGEVSRDAVEILQRAQLMVRWEIVHGSNGGVYLSFKQKKNPQKFFFQ